MKVHIYEWCGGYGAGLDYDSAEKPIRYYSNLLDNPPDWKYLGTWDLPDDFVEKCLPNYYME